MRCNLIFAAVLLMASCDTLPISIPLPTGPVVAPVSPPGGVPDLPGTVADAPTVPGPFTPAFLTTVNDAGDTLAVASGRVIGVGQTAGIQGRIVVPGNRTYGVIVGMEQLACNGSVRIVGIHDDGTAGMNRSLSPSDALDGWFADACQLFAFRVPGREDGRTYDFQILVEGQAVGETQIKTYFEVQGVAGPEFRWATHSKVEVRP